MAARVASFKAALAGLRVMLATEPHARVHLVATLAVVGLGFAFDVSKASWCWLVLAMTAVWVAEGFNTALESLADAISTQPNVHVGRAKDVAAGAVLLAALGASVIGVLVLGPPLWQWFTE